MTARRMVGELERLGENGRDFIVLGVDAPEFDQLTLKQKLRMSRLRCNRQIPE